MDRVIFHCDLNSFYASVELLDHPELRHLPVAVCGDPASRHGIILAEKTKRPPRSTGSRRAETIWQALEKSAQSWCSSPPTTTRYLDGEYCRRVNASLRRSTPTWWRPSASTRAGWT